MRESSDEVLRLASELSACLDEERTVLASGRSEMISDLTQRKNALVDRLESAAQAIHVDALEPRARRELSDVMHRCKQQNLANAALLDARVNQVRWALNQLGLGGPAVYGRDGKTQNQFTPRRVGSA